MGNYPWLADSWPTTNLVHSGKEAVNCCTTGHDTTERYYNGEMLRQANHFNSCNKLMFVVGVLCKSCPDSFSPSLSVSLVITGGTRRDQTKLISF